MIVEDKSHRPSMKRLEEILQYVNDFGETDACRHFNISIDSLHRYMRNKKFTETKNPQVILLDVETTPIETFAWGTFRQYIPHNFIKEPSFLISWTAKQLFSSQVMTDVLTPEEAIDKNDNRIVNSAWKVLEDSNVLIGHNLRRFDLRYLNTRFLMNNLKPPSPFQVIDTYEVAKRNFLFPSNKLDYLGTLIRNKGKLKTDFELWKQCIEGDSQALKNMQEYNKEDVLLLEEVFLFIRPFIYSHPNMAIYQESAEPNCPTCGSSDIKECGHYSCGRYQAYAKTSDSFRDTHTFDQFSRALKKKQT